MQRGRSGGGWGVLWKGKRERKEGGWEEGRRDELVDGCRLIHARKWRMATGCVEVVGKPMEEPERGRQRKIRWEREERRRTKLGEKRKRGSSLAYNTRSFIKLHWEIWGGGGGLEVRWWCMWGVRGKRAVKTKYNLKRLCSLRREGGRGGREVKEMKTAKLKLAASLLILLFPPFFLLCRGREGGMCLC